MQKMFSYRDITVQDAGSLNPILVHCSAGLGRTGTICAIFNILEGLKYSYVNREKLLEDQQSNNQLKSKFGDSVDHPVRFSIFGCVRKLREQRMLMVKERC